MMRLDVRNKPTLLPLLPQRTLNDPEDVLIEQKPVGMELLRRLGEAGQVFGAGRIAFFERPTRIAGSDAFGFGLRKRWEKNASTARTP